MLPNDWAQPQSLTDVIIVRTQLGHLFCLKSHNDGDRPVHMELVRTKDFAT